MTIPRPAAMAFGALLSVLAIGAGPALAAGTITVSGQGDARTVPDRAELSAGVATVAPTADAALAQNARKMTGVFDALKRIGVPDRNIQTSNFAVEPQYDTNNGSARNIVGYQISNEVTVSLDDSKKLGAALDVLVTAGANQINSVGFGISDPAALQTKAREAAMADALKRAQTYAKAGGTTVGAVLSIQETGSDDTVVVTGARFRARAMAATPIAAGEAGVTANVTVTYELR